MKNCWEGHVPTTTMCCEKDSMNFLSRQNLTDKGRHLPLPCRTEWRQIMSRGGQGQWGLEEGWAERNGQLTGRQETGQGGGHLNRKQTVTGLVCPVSSLSPLLSPLLLLSSLSPSHLTSHIPSLILSYMIWTGLPPHLLPVPEKREKEQGRPSGARVDSDH